MRNSGRFLTLILATALVASACTAGGGAAGGGQAGPAGGQYPRNQTLYTTGTQYGPPSSWNPIPDWQYTTGTEGYVYEPLFLYLPLEDEYKPWLAESGEWTADNVYEVRLREGVTWTDGEPFTAEDVVFTYELSQYESIPFHNVSNWLESAEAVDEHTVRFTFSEPRYQEWSLQLYQQAIVPEHLWKDRSEDEVVTGANNNPVGTGAYKYLTHDQDRMVWVKNEDWWATGALGLEVKPKYIVDIVNTTNENALGLVLQGDVDLSNNFLPGISSLVEGGYGVHTYYPQRPYMLSANTAWLVMNTTKKPMNDPAFRTAMSYAINRSEIVNTVYDGIVRAANPTGLLPAWDKYVNQSVVDELGSGYSPDRARAVLADAGYEDINGDGFVEAPDGSRINLSVIVPETWSDWEAASRIIADNAQAAGINLTEKFPDYNALVDARNSGNFDMVVNNQKQLSSTPWEYYNYIFRLPIQETQNTANFGRYENEEAWELVQDLGATPRDDVEGMKEVMSDLQRIQLNEMPIIPLWYNGMWSQANTSVWTNWPSAGDDTPNYVPTTWRNYLEMGGILALTELEPAPEEGEG